MSIHIKRESYMFLLISLVIVSFVWTYYNYHYAKHNQSSQNNDNQLNLNNELNKNTITYSTNLKIYTLEKEWFLEKCLEKRNIDDMSLEFLEDYLKKFGSSSIVFCNYVEKVFFKLFELEKDYGEIKMDPKFEKKVLKWLDNNEEYLRQASKQKIIKLYNKYIHEEMIYNPLRGKRPQSKYQVSEKNYTFNLLEESKKECDFCNKNYLTNTASDIFDRIETDLSYTAANTFKYDKWHSLIVSRNHNTLYLTEAEIVDMFKISLDWFKKVYELDNNAIYPEMIWDAMPKSGASQVHTHLQVSMGINSYYGAMRRILDASKRYFLDNQRSFFDDFIFVHKALGLTMKYNNTYVIVNLIPVKEQEIMLIGENDQNSYDTISRLIHFVTRAFVDKFEQYSFSMGMYLPQGEKTNSKQTANNFVKSKTINDNEKYVSLEKADKLEKIYARIVFRTPVANLRSDFNGLDIYTSSVLGIDRYVIAKKLFKELEDSIK